MAGKSRRNRREVISDKLNILDTKIALLTEKLSKLQDEKNALESELIEMDEAEKKAKEEADMKELINIMNSKGISVDELKDMMLNKNKVDNENQ